MPIFPRICHFFGKMGEYKLSLCEYKLGLCFLSPLLGARKFTSYCGKVIWIFSRKWCFFGKISLLPSQCPTKQMQYGRSGVRSPPGPCRSVGLSVEFEHVFWICRARLEFPEANFPKKLLQFWDFHPGLNFPKNLPQFWDFHPEPRFPKKKQPHSRDFSRIQTLVGTFVLRFRYFEFTARVCRRFEFTIGSTVAR